MRTSVYWIRHKDHTDIFSQGYVGISKNVEKRFNEHFRKTQNTHLKNAIAKYGWDNLVKQQVLIANEQYCLDMEKQLRPNDAIGWNCIAGGGKPPVAYGNKNTLGKPSWNKGISCSKDRKEKISVSVKKLWKNFEYRTNMSIAHIGQISPMRGKKHTIETIEKIRLKKIGKPSAKIGVQYSKETKQRMKELMQLQKWTCIHCNKSGLSVGAKNRWHFDNCKHKEQKCL
jgi:predicted GIY-YIG superfamily endonuclease/ribosomal protein L37AE/L43A